jgi:Sterol-sensing domain of SREBP cleavage-activation
VPVPQRVGDALAEAGPSITLAASAETLAFALGGFTSMPAVRNFALCAALAIFLDFLLQVRCSRGCRCLLSASLQSCPAAVIHAACFTWSIHGPLYVMQLRQCKKARA